MAGFDELRSPLSGDSPQEVLILVGTGRQEAVETHCPMLGETALGPATALVDQCLPFEEAAEVLLQHFPARQLVSFAPRSTRSVFSPLLIRWNHYSLSICPSAGLPLLQGRTKPSHMTMTDPCSTRPLMSAFVSCTASRQHYSTAVKAEGWRSSWPQSAGMTSGQTSAGHNLSVPPLPWPPVVLPKQ